MTEEEKLENRLKDKVVSIDGEDYRIDDVVVHKKKDSHMIASFTLELTAIDDPEKTVSMTIPYSALVDILNTLFSFKDVTADFVTEVESVANEAFRVSKKYKDKITRGLDAFADEFKKK